MAEAASARSILLVGRRISGAVCFNSESGILGQDDDIDDGNVLHTIHFFWVLGLMLILLQAWAGCDCCSAGHLSCSGVHPARSGIHQTKLMSCYAHNSLAALERSLTRRVLAFQCV
eukprot:996515-Amphidinium_carterae.1